MTRDVFHDDDGVVDNEPGGDGERHEREVVEAEIQQVHHGEGSDERNRNGDAGDEGGTRAAQKDEDHQNHQDDGTDEGSFHRRHRGANGGGAIQNRCDLDALGEDRGEEGQLGFDVVDGLNDVGAGLAEEDDEDGVRAIHVAGRADVLGRVIHGGDVGKAHGRSVVGANDERAVVSRFRNLVVGDDVRRDGAIGKLAARLVGVLEAEERLNRREGQAEAFQLGGVHLDAHGRCSASADDDLADAADLRQLLLEDVTGRIVDLTLRQRFRCHRQDEDRRIGRINLAIGRIGLQTRRQVGAGGVDRGLHVARRAIDVAGQIELERDLAAAQGTRRGHLRYVRDVSELPLQGGGDGGRHDGRAGAGQVGVHVDGGEIDLGQRRYGEHHESDGARDGHGDGEQRGAHRPFDECPGEGHEWRSSGVGIDVPACSAAREEGRWPEIRWPRRSKKM